MTCFGAAIYPVTEKEYMNSKEMWMWRAYNGSLYSQGNQLPNKVEKIHNNDLVKFELDCEEHTLKLFLNDKEMSESFKNVKGTIYPAGIYIIIIIISCILWSFTKCRIDIC